MIMTTRTDGVFPFALVTLGNKGVNSVILGNHETNAYYSEQNLDVIISIIVTVGVSTHGNCVVVENIMFC